MSYSFIHTSDWHLGKKLFKESRLPEQESFLSWLLVQLKRYQVKALCLSGDVFDTPYPSFQAQSLYYQFLKEAVEQSDLEIFIISGNHDSGRFLEAPLPFLKEKSIHIVGSLDPHEKEYSFHRDGVSFHLLPYFRTHELYNYAQAFFPEELNNLEDKTPPEKTLSILERLIDQAFTFKPGQKNVLLGHHLFGYGKLAGSELGLTLSGLDHIPLNLFNDKFDYLALGHLHNHQYLSKKEPIVCYTGSPLPFRFSERKNKKLNLIQSHLKEPEGELKITELSIPSFRSLYELKLKDTNYKSEILELVKNLPLGPSENELIAFLEIKLSSKRPLTGVADEIRELLKDHPIKLLSLQSKITQSHVEDVEKETLSTKSTEELFEDFYLQKYEGESELPRDLKSLFIDLLNEVREENR